MSAPAPHVDALSDLQQMRELGDASPRDLGEAQKTALRTLFEDTSGVGLYNFAYTICGFELLYPPLHFEICRFLSRWGDLDLASPMGQLPTSVNRPEEPDDEVERSWRRLMLCIPRDSFKTSLGTIANSLWCATRDPNVTIAIFNENAEKSRGWVGAIANTISNSMLYQLLWPERLPRGISFTDSEAGRTMRKDTKWGNSGVRLVRDSNPPEHTIQGYGIGGATTGYHFSHMIKDDLIGETGAESPAIMKDVIHWIDHARNLEKPSENGLELVNFTRWAYRDPYSHIWDKWPGEYQLYMRHQLELDRRPDIVKGESIFPPRMSTKQARKIANNPETAYEFMSQRQNTPRAGRESSFDPGWIRTFSITGWETGEPMIYIDKQHYDPTLHNAMVVDLDSPPRMLPLRWLRKAIILDPAPMKKSETRAEPRARNGLVAAGKDPWGRMFMFEGVPIRDEPVAVLDQTVTLARKWKTNQLSIEEVNFSMLYEPLWTEIMRFRYPDFEFMFLPVTTQGRDKDVRIQSMIPAHRQGLMYYNDTDTGYITQELLEYPHGDTKDLIDAMAYIDEAISRPATPEERTLMTRRERSMAAHRDPVCGY